MASSYQEMLYKLLPSHIYFQIFSKKPDRSQIIATESREHLINALMNCKSIDWQVYAANVGSLAEAGLMPAEHFLTEGIFEGRKLSYKLNDLDAQDDSCQPPLISVIIVNYNNSIYLKKCIESVINQTLSNIEIIIVDDCSQDNSVNIIKSFCQKDARIKPIYFECNKSQHMAKKYGVQYATGQYIMFLDSDDFYSHNACETAYSIIYSGYDVGGYNFSLIVPAFANENDVIRYSNYALRTEECSFYGIDILYNTFITSKITPHITNKIFNSTICKKAFSQLEDGRFTRGEDNYEAIALLNNARSFHFMPVSLYNHPIFMGIATIDSTNYKINEFLNTGSVWKAIKRYVAKSYIPYNFDMLKECGIKETMQAFFEYVTQQNLSNYFDTVAEQYGFEDVLFYLMSNYFLKWSQVAEKFLHYNMELKNSTIKSICIYLPLYTSDDEWLVKSICNILQYQGYNISIIIEINKTQTSFCHKGVDVVLINSSLSYQEDLIKNNLHSIIHLLSKNNFDLILYFGAWNQASLWQFIIFKYFKVPFILISCAPFYASLIDKRLYDMQQVLSVMRIADQVWTFNSLDDTFYRIAGINCEQIPLPISNKLNFEARTESSKINLLLGININDKFIKLKDALEILYTIRKSIKNINMILLGDFKDKKSANIFFEHVRKLELLNNIKITGDIYDFDHICQNIDFAVITSFSYDHPDMLVNILKNDIQCFMYDLPGIPGNDCPGVFIFAQGDYLNLANALINAIDTKSNFTERFILSTYANKFLPFDFDSTITSLLSTFRTSSSVKYLENSTYTSIMHAISFYTSTQYCK